MTRFDNAWTYFVRKHPLFPKLKERLLKVRRLSVEIRSEREKFSQKEEDKKRVVLEKVLNEEMEKFLESQRVARENFEREQQQRRNSITRKMDDLRREYLKRKEGLKAERAKIVATARIVGIAPRKTILLAIKDNNASRDTNKADD